MELEEAETPPQKTKRQIFPEQMRAEILSKIKIQINQNMAKKFLDKNTNIRKFIITKYPHLSYPKIINKFVNCINQMNKFY